MKKIILLLNSRWSPESCGICRSLWTSVPSVREGNVIHTGAVRHSCCCACHGQEAGAFSVLRQQVLELDLKALSWVPSGIRQADVFTVTGCIKKSPMKWTLLFSTFQCLGNLLRASSKKEKKNPSWAEIEIFHEAVDRASPLMITP